MVHRFAAAALICAALPVAAADFSDPTWPCVQRKVERLSVGLMWPHPLPEAVPQHDAVASDVAELAGKLALRRIDPADLAPDIAAFADAYAGDPNILGLVFSEVFDSLAQRRTRIIDGIGDFSLSQIALSDRIEGARQEMTTLMAGDAPDYDRIDALEEQIDWDQIIFSDRQKSIQYLCETPTLLEQRIYSIAQLLLRETSS